MMNVTCLQTQDAEAVQHLAQTLLAEREADPIERELKSWTAPWRPEALEHYLALGWSLGAWQTQDSSKLAGYVLAQPLLFFRTRTQTLWLEYAQARTPEILHQLIETCVRWAKDKHIQEVVFPEVEDMRQLREVWPAAHSITEQLGAIKTTK